MAKRFGKLESFDTGKTHEISEDTLEAKYFFIFNKLKEMFGEYYDLSPVDITISDRTTGKKVEKRTPEDFQKDMPDEKLYMLSAYLNENILFRGTTPQRIEELLLHEVEKMELRPSKPNEPNASINWSTAASFTGRDSHFAVENPKDLVDQPLGEIKNNLLSKEYRMPYSMAIGFSERAPGIKVERPTIDRGGNTDWDQRNRIVTGELHPDDVKYVILRFYGDKPGVPKTPAIFRLTPKPEMRKAA